MAPSGVRAVVWCSPGFGERAAERRAEHFPRGDEERRQDRTQDEAHRAEEQRPPSVEKKMSSSCILVSWPTSRGRSTLSTLPTTSAQNRARAMPSPDLAGGDEDDRRRHPDERAADARDDRQDGHHRSPEDRTVETHGPERQPSKHALSHADQDRALERRAGDRHELLDHALLVGLRERQVRQNGLEQARTAGQEEKHRVEQHDELKDEDRRGACRGGERGEEETRSCCRRARRPW